MTEIAALAADLTALAADHADRRVVVGIAGRPGAGKTTLAAALVRELAGAAVTIPLDGFHLADVALDILGRRDRKGAPDTFDPRGCAALLRRLRTEPGSVFAPGFERNLEQPLAQAIIVDEQPIILVEGNYLLLDEPGWRLVRGQLAQVWWLEGDETERIADLTARHVRFGKTPAEAAAWVGRVDQPNAATAAASADRADRVVHR